MSVLSRVQREAMSFSLWRELCAALITCLEDPDVHVELFGSYQLDHDVPPVDTLWQHDGPAQLAMQYTRVHGSHSCQFTQLVTVLQRIYGRGAHGLLFSSTKGRLVFTQTFLPLPKYQPRTTCDRDFFLRFFMQRPIDDTLWNALLDTLERYHVAVTPIADRNAPRMEITLDPEAHPTVYVALQSLADHRFHGARIDLVQPNLLSLSRSK